MLGYTLFIAFSIESADLGIDCSTVETHLDKFNYTKYKCIDLDIDLKISMRMSSYFYCNCGDNLSMFQTIRYQFEYNELLLLCGARACSPRRRLK